MKQYLIIDGMNFFIRSFSVNPTMDVNGNHVGGVVGFMMSLNKIIRENSPDQVIIVWDGEGGSLKRRSLFKDYKAGRKPKLNRQYDFEDIDQQLASFANQIAKVEEYLEMLPVTQMKFKGVEADDVIAYLSRFIINDHKKIIVSSDRDFYQLLDKNTVIYIPTKKKYFASSDLCESMNIIPENFIFMKALTGDRSDNIDGVKGVGPKSVIKLFPFLSDEESTIQDILKYAENNKDKNKKYDLIVESSSIVINNIKIMQLSSPLMSPLTAKAIRMKVDDNEVKFKPTELRLQLHKDGMQIKSSDFFINFKEHYNRCGKVE